MSQVQATELVSITDGVVDYQVFQRNEANQADIVLSGTATTSGTLTAGITTSGTALANLENVQLGQIEPGSWSAKIIGIPVGGPYELTIRFIPEDTSEPIELVYKNLLVGDLWVLAGQSNMEGIGYLKNAETPSPRVHALRMNHRWYRAEEPLHRRYESVDPIHHEMERPFTEEESDVETAKRDRGAGLGLRFGKVMVARTGVPIGLIIAAHGGTSMAQWDPNLAELGGNSLYGSMLRSIQKAGGRIAGVLWYQGESDTMVPKIEEVTAVFPDKCKELVDSIRRDVGNEELPFYYVQIGNFACQTSDYEKYWSRIREHQRLLEKEIPNAGMVTAVDLELDDPIHINTAGLKVLGERLANLAIGNKLRGPRLQSIKYQFPVIRLEFSDVNGELFPKEKLAGFSIRNASGDYLRLIFHQRIAEDSPTAVELFLRDGLPKDAWLWYGYGYMPFCNMVDSENMALPAMGPLMIPRPETD